jgi:hypothetical protein
MHDRSVRNLARLQASGSTFRMFNLLAISRAHGSDPDYLSSPVFKHPHLNRTIVLKHRLRRNEGDLFSTPRTTATKVILPIDSTDLKLGGHYVFVGQIGFDATFAATFGETALQESVDRRTLELLDQLPSLDPFLLREQLRRAGVSPAPCYFDISPGDRQKMFAFVETEIEALVRMCLGSDTASGTSGARFVRKILSTQVDVEMEPLRLTLRLAPEEYQEGVFCWRGFLFYKWTLDNLTSEIGALLTEVDCVRPMGASVENGLYIEKMRAGVRGRVLASCDMVRGVIKTYDDAYARLVAGRPQAFREFLRDAPRMFSQLGEHLGALRHIVSFWRYRFPKSHPRQVPADELEEILTDFEQSLALPEGQVPRALADAAA